MTGKVLILGARGRFGRAAVQAFGAANWQVRAFARSWSRAPERTAKATEGELTATHPEGELAANRTGTQQPRQSIAGSTTGIEQITGDAFDAGQILQAARGCDVIINALNPPYHHWARDLPRLTKAVIAAAHESGATIMAPGNVYNFGQDMPLLLVEDFDFDPSCAKGRLRVQMEQAYKAAASQTGGPRTIILRAGDFIEQAKTGNWFDGHICKNLARGQVMYPGPVNVMHAWAYLPDLARAMVGLAQIRDQLAPYEAIGFPGFALDGQTLIDCLQQLTGTTLKRRTMPWRMIRLLGVMAPGLREVGQMEYLWRAPHAIDGAGFARHLPDFVPTPIMSALAQAIGQSAPQHTAPMQLQKC